MVLGDNFTYQWLYAPVATAYEPWRMLTSAFLHSATDPLHLLFNMYSLWVFGRAMENVLGRARFLALYLLAAFGGSVGVLWLSDPTTPVLGASGAIFGLMAAYFVIVRSMGGNTAQMAGIIAINLVYGFLVPGVAWQAHVGGLVVGAAVGLIYSKTRSARAKQAQVLLLLLVLVLLVVATYIGVNRIMMNF
jgi:membrane associated rhomboid family serine protease